MALGEEASPAREGGQARAGVAGLHGATAWCFGCGACEAPSSRTSERGMVWAASTCSRARSWWWWTTPSCAAPRRASSSASSTPPAPRRCPCAANGTSLAVSAKEVPMRRPSHALERECSESAAPTRSAQHTRRHPCPCTPRGPPVCEPRGPPRGPCGPRGPNEVRPSPGPCCRPAFAQPRPGLSAQLDPRAPLRMQDAARCANGGAGGACRQTRVARARRRRGWWVVGIRQGRGWWLGIR